MPRLAGVLQEAATGGDNTGFTRCGETARRVFNLAQVWALTPPDHYDQTPVRKCAFRP